MNIFSDRKKIVNILFAAALIILIANLLLDKFYSVPEPQTIELTTAQVDSSFHTALNNLGINENWVKSKKSKEESLYYSVSIPNDLPAVLILQELNNVIDTSQAEIKSVEKKIGGGTTLEISSAGIKKLKADISFNSQVRRKTVRVGFIIKRSGNDIETDSLLLNYPEHLAFLVTPSDENKVFVKKINKEGKEYIVYLNDEIDELKFRLDESYSKVRLKNSIKEIVGTFPGAIFFMIDDNSSLYNSDVYPILKEELEKRKISLKEESSFKKITSSGNNISLLFNRSLAELEGGQDEIFILSSGDFLELKYDIIRFRKLGYRFTSPSALITSN